MEPQTEQNEQIIEEKIELKEENVEKTETEEDGAFEIFTQTLTGSKIQSYISKQDSNIELKQLLIECVETCYLTSYELSIKGKPIEEYGEIANYPEIQSKSILKMKFVPYDEKGARLHFYRLREILESGVDELYLASGSIVEKPSKQDLNYPSFAHLLETEPYPELKAALNCDHSDDPKVKLDSKVDFSPDSFSLTSLEKLKPSSKNISCLKRISLSGWNPAPSNRKLSGDLFYLVVETLEGKLYHITACPNGFYINGSTDTIFDPSHMKKATTNQTLVGLLSKFSKQFQTNFPLLLQSRIQKHPFEVTPIPFKPNKWTDCVQYHTYNMNRSEDSQFKMLGVDPRSQQREWNEEYQSCKELPSSTIDEKTMRDRTLFKIHCDFVEAATQGAKNIIENCVHSMNPNEPLPAQVFLQNNIFYSFAVDTKNIENASFSSHESHCNANNDLKGVIAFNEADVKGVHTLATAVVDYRGFRIICQSIIPGILTGDQSSKQVYGALDEGKTFSENQTYHDLLSEVGKRINLKEHSVLDEQNKEFKLIGPSELKGILGSDGRFYVLDLARTTPKDTNFKDISTAIVRRELIRSYVKHQFTMDYFKAREDEYHKMIQEELKKQSESPKESQEVKPEGEVEEVKKEVKPKEEVKLEEEVKSEGEVKLEEVKPEGEEEDLKQEKKLFQFNVDVFTASKVTGENVENDSKDVTDLSDFLVDKVIPSLVSEFQNLEAMPLDGPSLTDVFHDRGINMRYLGKVATLCQSIPHIITLCEQEMFVRCLKQEFRSMLRKTTTDQLMTSILKFLNSIFGKNSENQKKKMIQIVKLVKDKFQYSLDKNFNFVRLSTLRSFCLRVGLKIVTKDYDYESKTPFNFESILGLEPTVKHSTPKSMNANGFLELGRQQLLVGQFESAYEFLSQSMIMFQQVQGPMNKEVATCFSHLGTILLQSNDVVQSILNQHKALIICRRVMGVDSAIESNLYQLLGLLCHSFGQPEFALKHFLRAKYINDLICGSDHPDTALILANIASMYQEMGDNQKCFAYMEKAIAMNERVLGIDHLQTATTYHSIALMYGMIQKPKIALDYEKKNYRILMNKFGIQDLRVMESSQWLEMFTGKAVKAQKEMKKETLATQLKKQKLNQN